MLGILLVLGLMLALGFALNAESASGPFSGEAYQASLNMLISDERVAYKSGQLDSYSATASHGPVIAYWENGKYHWAVELKTGDDPALRVTKITEMRVSYGLLRDRIDFFAEGTSEPGWLLLWKISATKEFYLKMF